MYPSLDFILFPTSFQLSWFFYLCSHLPFFQFYYLLQVNILGGPLEQIVKRSRSLLISDVWSSLSLRPSTNALIVKSSEASGDSSLAFVNLFTKALSSSLSFWRTPNRVWVDHRLWYFPRREHLSSSSGPIRYSFALREVLSVDLLRVQTARHEPFFSLEGGHVNFPLHLLAIFPFSFRLAPDGAFFLVAY